MSDDLLKNPKVRMYSIIKHELQGCRWKLRDSKVRENQEGAEDKGSIQWARGQVMGLPDCWEKERVGEMSMWVH